MWKSGWAEISALRSARMFEFQSFDLLKGIEGEAYSRGQ
jgi:hypothetical protein